MNVTEMLTLTVPRDLFVFKTEGTVEEQAQNLIDQCHPGATKMKLLRLSPELSEATIPYDMSNRALHGLMHGGCLFSVGDTLTAIMSAYFVEHADERTLTMEASIRYLRPVARDTVTAKARLQGKKGKQLNFVCDFFNEQNKRVAQAKYRYVLAVPR